MYWLLNHICEPVLYSLVPKPFSYFIYFIFIFVLNPQNFTPSNGCQWILASLDLTNIQESVWWWYCKLFHFMAGLEISALFVFDHFKLFPFFVLYLQLPVSLVFLSETIWSPYPGSLWEATLRRYVCGRVIQLPLLVLSPWALTTPLSSTWRNEKWLSSYPLSLLTFHLVCFPLFILV